MQIMSTGVEISGKEYTWGQSLRFFVIGALWAIGASLPPVLTALWHNYQNYNDPIDWELMRELTIASIGPALFFYWQKHKALLKLPPWLNIPEEFRPEKVTTVQQQGPKATEVKVVAEGKIDPPTLPPKPPPDTV